MSHDESAGGRERRSSRKPGTTHNKLIWNTGAFTDEEKELVLSALYSFGPNVDRIAPLIITRTREQVRDFLTSWYRRIKKVPVVLSGRDHQTTKIKEPIELWLEKIRKETEHSVTSNEDMLSPWIPYTLGYIAKFEKHPRPNLAGGADFRKLYEFLESALNGNAPQDVSFSDALFILSSMRKLKLRLEKVNFHHDETHIQRCGSAVQPRTYKRIKKEEPDLESAKKKKLEDFLSSQMVNPLRMPMENLCVKERIKNQLNV